MTTGAETGKAPLRRLLGALGSLRLTVPLFAMAIFLTFAGTLAQVDLGLWTVLSEYFRTIVAWIDFQIFFPRSMQVPGSFPFPGGWLIGGLLVINLLAAHGLRFQVKAHGGKRALGFLVLAAGAVLVFLLCIDRVGVQPGGLSTISIGWGILLGITLVLLAGGVLLFEQRAGVVIAHSGLMVLLLSELITGLFAVEGQMLIAENGSSNFTERDREPELAIIDRSDPKDDVEYTIPHTRLVDGAVIRDAALPFHVEVVDFMKNSSLGPIASGAPGAPDAPTRATAGTGLEMFATEMPEVSGTAMNADDMPSAYVKLIDKRDGSDLGTLLVSYRFYANFTATHFGSPLDLPQQVSCDGKTYDVYLRSGRTYEPYTIHLKDFRHDLYPGTTIPKDFSSFVRLEDPTRGVDHEVRIWMNHPLRHQGQTFYQQSFLRGDKGTVLQVVNNPGWAIPYISCLMVAAGLIFHFLGKLKRFVGRTQTTTTTRVAPPLARGERFAPYVALALGIALIAPGFFPPQDPVGGMQVRALAKLPVTHAGRVKPLDSLARTFLLQLGDRQSWEEEPGPVLDAAADSTAKAKPVRRSAIEFLLNVKVGSDAAFAAKVFRIANDQLLSMLGLQTREGLRYSLDEFKAHVNAIDLHARRADAKDPADRDAFDVASMELYKKLTTWMDLVAGDIPHVIPPSAPGDGWHTVSEFDEISPPATWREFNGVIGAFAHRDASEFNAAVAGYRTALEQAVPKDVRKAAAETSFNHFGPFGFSKAILLYLLAFVACLLSLLGWTRGFLRAALTLTTLAVVIHGLGIAMRVWLTDKGPVTNLYASALFIGWGAVVLALAMQRFYRSGFGTFICTFVGTTIGVLTLLVADGLQGSSDTMEVLQAVLDTNFWLWTHVLCITLGYTATFFAGFLAIMTIVGGVFSKALDATTYRVIGRMTYGVLCFATLLSFVGTVLGGIWADQSWGRFWGWDPKENGALMIVLWNALILHARWGGLVRERGVAALAVVGNVVVSWSWFGVNMLGVGLHSYGFMESAMFWLMVFIGSQVGILGLAMIPMHRWRGGAGAAG